MVIRRIADPPLTRVGYLRADLIEARVVSVPHMPRGPFLDGWHNDISGRVNLVPQTASSRLPHVVVHLCAPRLAVVDAGVSRASEGVDQLVAVMLVKRLPPRRRLAWVAQAYRRRKPLPVWEGSPF